MAEIRAGVAIAATSKDRKLAEVLEEAMAAEVTKCYAEGVMEPTEVRTRMLAAKDAAKAEYFAALTEEASPAEKAE